MTRFHYGSLAVLLLASSPLFASGDGDGCSFWLTECALPTYPLFLNENDTRSNLMLLLADQQHLLLPFELPKDPINERAMPLFSLQRLPLPGEQETSAERQQLEARLSAYDPALPKLLEPYAGHDSLYGRAISNSLSSVTRFIDGLEQSELAQDERAGLIKARLQLLGDAPITPPAAPHHTKPWWSYLAGASHFYAGAFEQALSIFGPLQRADEPWVAESATYMVMRTYLNMGMESAKDEYGDTDITKGDKTLLGKALAQGEAYLNTYPQGRYAASTRGLFRRIHWMSGNRDALRDAYQDAMAIPRPVAELEALVNEIDQTLLSADATPPFRDMQQPELLFINTLRDLRLTYDEKKSWNDEDLSTAITHLQSMGKPEQANYLRAYALLLEKQFEAALALLPAAATPATTLDFSRQILRVWALQGVKANNQVESELKRLIAAPLTEVQQAFIQNLLADHWVRSGNVAAVFAKGSPITQLRLRATVLKQATPPTVLRQQVGQGMSQIERQLALHTLLVRDLISQNYTAFLEDVTRIPTDYKEVSPPADAPWEPVPNQDIPLSQFQWHGDGTPAGYFCRDLATTLGTLITRPDDGHALNCLGEYIRHKEPQIDLWYDSSLIWGLPAARVTTAPSRLALYQKVIDNPKAEPEDKSYALYRAINCYAPSGYNSCDDQEIAKQTRQQWFNTLKKRYGNSVWAQSLKYYW